MTIATWNIAGGHTSSSKDQFNYRPEEQSDYFAHRLEQIRADVVLLQESHTKPGDSLSRRLARCLNLRYVFETNASPSHIDSGYNLAQAVISRFPLEQQRSIRLPQPSFAHEFRNPKELIVHDKYMQLAICNGITIANVHLLPIKLFGYDYSSKSGLEYIHDIETTMNTYLNNPCIIGGDFNFNEAAAKLNGLYHALQLNEAARHDIPTRPDGTHTDYLLVSSPLNVLRSAILPTKSDHYLYWTTIN